MAEWSQVRGQTKVYQDPMKEQERGGETLPGGSPGTPSGARPRCRAHRPAPGSRVCHGARPGTAQKGDVAASPSLSAPQEGETGNNPSCVQQGWDSVDPN